MLNEKGESIPDREIVYDKRQRNLTLALSGDKELLSSHKGVYTREWQEMR